VKDSSLYHELVAKMRSYGNAEFAADLERFIDSYADHDPDCLVDDDRPPREIESCTCGFARRHEFYAQLQLRLASGA